MTILQKTAHLERMAQDKQAAGPAGVVLQCSVYGSDSASQEGWAVARGLSRAELPLRLAPLDTPGTGRDASPAATDNLERLQHGRLDLARSVLYYTGPPQLWNLDVRGRCRVGRAGFWTDRVPQAWLEPCNALDELWLPSEFQRHIFNASGVPEVKLRVLPSGVDTTLFRPGAPRLKIPGAKAFNFLAVSNLHDRQGCELLLEAFLQEFRAKEDVALWLKVAPHHEDSGDLEAELAFFLERRPGRPLQSCPTIVLIDEAVSPATMASLYASADAFVRPESGSLYGRALLEALSSGLPVIATRWGAPLDFLHDENSYFVDVERLAPAALGQEFAAGHLWAQPSREHLRQRLRQVFTQREEARKRGLHGRSETVERRDWTVVLPQWEQTFRELLS